MRQRGAALPAEQPQLLPSIGGVPVPGGISLEINSVAYFAADRFRIVFAIGAAPFATTAYFAALGLQAITIKASLGGIGYATLLVGQIDNIRIDLLANTTTLSGRDLSARLIDTEISETFANQTSSQIATTIAARHQLTANVTATTVAVGQYYELDHARSALGLNSRMRTEWNLLAALAQVENYGLSVVGNTLNFCPPPATAIVSVTPQNFLAISLDIAAALPQSTTVQSWSSRNKNVVSGTQGSGAGTTMIRPNLTAAQAQAIATNHLATLGQHSTILMGTMPADLSLMPGTQLALSGTYSIFDQTYVVQSISRTLHGRSGFIQTIRAGAVL
jgi:hypothetical protein